MSCSYMYYSIMYLVYRCKCGHCLVMPTANECVCCCEIDAVMEKMEGISSINCVTDHEGFDAVRLNT